MPDNLIGRKVNDRYQIIEKLGAGGLGDVYRAKDLVLDREVAIKAVRSDNLLTASSTPDLFLKEAKIIAALDHPNILTIFDVVKQNDPDYPVLLVIKLAKGGSLHSRIHPPGIAPRVLPPTEAATILTQVAAALDYAHSQRVIHLDIKPSNILFSDETGQMALVADFGLARLLQTTTHVALKRGAGTPSYMPQEQRIGGDAGRYSDVYALGITLYEMLTGEVPKISFETSGFVVQLKRPLPERIKQVITRATMLDPHLRYQSAGELVSAFKATLQESGAHISPASSTSPAPNQQQVLLADSAPRALRLPTKRLTDREKLHDVLRALGQFAEKNPAITEQELVAYTFKPQGLFAALGYDKQDKNVFSEQYRPGIVLLMVTGRPLAVMEFKRPVFSITDGLEQLERQYIARLHPDVGVLCNGRELWIYRRTGEFLYHPPALRLLLSQVDESEAEAVYNWLGRRVDDAAPELYTQYSSHPGGYPGVTQNSGSIADAIPYPPPPPAGWTPSSSYPPYFVYPVYPPSGPIPSPMQMVKRVSPKATISLWLGILTLFIGIIVVAELYSYVGPQSAPEIIAVTLAFLLGIITVVLGHLAKREIRRSNKQMKGTIRAIFGLIFGYFNTAFFLLTLLVDLFPTTPK